MKLRKFNFNSDAFDFWSIYEIIKKYYPLGIFTKKIYQENSFFKKYPGTQDLWAILFENIHNDKNFRAQWKAIAKRLKTALSKTIVGTTYGQAPSFSGYIQLEISRTQQLTHTKELHFAISLLGPFYTIYGLDFVNIELEDDTGLGETTYALDSNGNLTQEHTHIPDSRQRNYSTVNAVTVSPYQEYKTIFETVEQQIKEHSPGHRMIPFDINFMYLKGLKTTYKQKGRCSIYNALFNDHYNLNDIEETAIRGDKKYGYDAWRTVS